MNTVKTILLIFLLLILLYSSYAAEQDINLKQVYEKNVIIRDIGNNEMIIIIMAQLDGNSYWFLLKEYGNILLGENLSSFFQVDSILASSDEKYLAVISVGEGHPILEVVDLEILRKHRKYKVLQELNPYPGIINILCWNDSRLILCSDAPLEKIKEGVTISVDQLRSENKQFSLDIKTGTIKSIQKE